MEGQDGSPSDALPDNVVHLGTPPATRFLRSLAKHPFLCIVLEDGHVKLYERGMDPAVLDDLLRTINSQAD